MTCIVEMFFRVVIVLIEDADATEINKGAAVDIVMTLNLVGIEDADMVIMINVDHMNTIVMAIDGVENVEEVTTIKL